MERFEAGKGLIHITFANEDRYFKNSLLCLNLQQNLYYELKQKDYDAVCFVNLSGEKFHITFGNDTAATMFSRSVGNGVWGKLRRALGSSDSLSMSKELLIESSKSEELLNRLISMMKKERRLAVVFSMDAFAAFENVDKVVQGFGDVSEDNYNKKNILLIVAPTAVEGSLKHFKNPQSIYRSKLFPAIQSIFENYENVHLYDRLKNDMPNRISYMNRLEVEEIENLVRYMIMQEDMDVLFTAQDYADCIWYIYNSVTFYNWAKRFCKGTHFAFPPNPGRELRVIEKVLKDEKIYRILDSIILEIRELSHSSDRRLSRLIPQTLGLSDYGENNQQYLFWNNDILQRMETLSGDFIRDDKKKREVQTRLAEIRKSLNSPYICCTDGNRKRREDFMADCFERAFSAMINKDENTFFSAAEGMHYVVCVCEEDIQWNVDREAERDKNNVKETGMICYQKIMSCQETLFELRKDIDKDNHSFDNENKEVVQIRKEIAQMEKDFPYLPGDEKAYLERSDKGNEKSMLLIRYLEKKIRVRNIIKSLKSRKNTLDAKYSDVNQIENAIRNMQGTLSRLSLSTGKFLHNDLSNSLESIESVFKQVNTLQKNWNKLDETIDKTYTFLEDLDDAQLEAILKEYESNEEFYLNLV